MSEEIKKVNDLKLMIIDEINNANDLVTLKAVADKHLSKKSELNSLMSLIKQLSGDEKTAFGQAMNNARKELNELYQAKEKLLNEAMIRAKLEKEQIDITLPGIKYNVGGINPFFKISYCRFF